MNLPRTSTTCLGTEGDTDGMVGTYDGAGTVLGHIRPPLGAISISSNPNGVTLGITSSTVGSGSDDSSTMSSIGSRSTNGFKSSTRLLHSDPSNKDFSW